MHFPMHQTLQDAYLMPIALLHQPRASHSLLLPRTAAFCITGSTRTANRISLDRCWELAGATMQSHTNMTTAYALGVKKMKSR